MKKLLVVLMTLAFAASAFAVDVKLSGNFEVVGNKLKGYNLQTSDNAANGQNDYWEQDMNLTSVFVVDSATSITLKAAIHDKTWDNTTGTGDDDITIERAYLTHKFNDMFTLTAGDQDFYAWGTSFADDKSGGEGVKLHVKIPTGKVVLAALKIAENGSNTVKDNEKDDADVYKVGYVGKFGPVSIMPAYTMKNISSSNTDKGSSGDKWNNIELAATGDFGMFGFEAEYVSHNVSKDATAVNSIDDKDYSVYGLYANVFAKIDKIKVGGLYATGSVDEVSNAGTKKYYGFDFDDDFDSLVVLEDGVEFGSGAGTTASGTGSSAEHGLVGMNVYQLYVDAALTDKISAFASYSLVTSNFKSGQMSGSYYLDDMTATELDASVAYALSDAVTYTAGFGMAKVKDVKTTVNGNKQDLETISKLYHKIAVKF